MSSPSMSWLASRVFRAATHHGHEWRFTFDNGVVITVECLWRLLKDDRLVVTSEDDGHAFGRPAPVDAAAKVCAALANRALERADLRESTGDLTLRFAGGSVLEFVTSSTGYEAWRADYPGGSIVATGCGQLSVHGTSTPSV